MVVDADSRVRFANEHMQGVLGRRPDELHGEGLEACVPEGDRPQAHKLVKSGLNGAASEGELHVVTRGGRRLALHVKLTPEGKGRSRGLVLVAAEVREASEAAASIGDCTMEVSRVGARLGRIESLRFMDQGHDARRHVGCEVLELLESIGASAAVTAVDAVLHGRTAEATAASLPTSERAFRLVTARALDDRTVRVVVRCFDARVLSDLVDAKVSRVAEACGLSDRERQVLQLLLRGRGLADIATMLEIAPRTVKFHQANVLQKLGADSRFDLLRVVL
ncbi:MAG TPA: LuxR C-terminal-related transcriptional regulator [Polyangiaceae bacterium]